MADRNRARRALTAAAAHLRECGEGPAAALVDAWRDRHHPLVVTPEMHRWKRGWELGAARDGLERRCVKCGLEQRFEPLVEGCRPVGVWAWPDGRRAQRSKTKTPPCNPKEPPIDNDPATPHLQHDKEPAQ